MNLITEPFRGLVRKKLWPVALLLVAALVAVPFTLAKEPEVPIASSQQSKRSNEPRRRTRTTRSRSRLGAWRTLPSAAPTSLGPGSTGPPRWSRSTFRGGN